MEIQEILKLIVELLIVTGVGWVLKGMLSKVMSQLDKVLSNQQAQEVTVAEIKKDVHRMSEDTKVIGYETRDLNKRVNQLEINVSALKARSDG